MEAEILCSIRVDTTPASAACKSVKIGITKNTHRMIIKEKEKRLQNKFSNNIFIIHNTTRYGYIVGNHGTDEQFIKPNM
ncbi:MAG: hypothetical protein OI74_15565 [Gammaproteobacteria bacterium (ex Lamellibrachia satsuma)]|nr:MAG: hypothetical protein OI74_15565 [Gammaproteobacteria bacterium (ex Lamellibrachia satsuma)]